MDERSPEFAAAHERHLASYRAYPTEVYCNNRQCQRYGEAITVFYEEEYGAGWTTPEHCECGDPWSFDPPPLGEEEEA